MICKLRKLEMQVRKIDEEFVDFDQLYCLREDGILNCSNLWDEEGDSNLWETKGAGMRIKAATE